jgi:hypothetical protein
VCGTLHAQDKVHFGYVVEEGFTESYKIKFNQDTDLGFFVMRVFVDMEVTEKCIGVDDTGFLMQVTFDKVESSQMYQEKMSETPLAANLTGNSVTYHVDRHGEVTDIKAVGYIEGWASAEKIVEPVIESGYSYMPDEEVPKGGEWGKDAETEKTDQGMEVITTSVYTFKEMKEEKGRDCAKVEGKVENTITGQANTPQGPMTADGTGEGKFEMYFDPKTSRVVKVKTSMDIRMDLVPDSGGDPVETTITYSLEREIV